MASDRDLAYQLLGQTLCAYTAMLRVPSLAMLFWTPEGIMPRTVIVARSFAGTMQSEICCA
eukprot:3512305-Amphidinium_carterae.1